MLVSVIKKFKGVPRKVGIVKQDDFIEAYESLK